jgi:DNA modification methylase
MVNYTNRLLHGDCLELMQDIPDKSIDMILCDLPYGTTACKWDVIIPFEPLWKEYKRIIKDRGCIALFGSEPFSSHLRMSNIKQYKYDWIWDKITGTDFFQSKKRPLKSHENISVFGWGAINYFPIMTETKKENKRDRIRNFTKGTENTIYGNTNKYIPIKDESRRYPLSVFKYSFQGGEIHKTKRFHPTQKPVALLEYLIKTYTLENETVLDNCMGSGSTGVACINTNRNFIGIEKDETFFNIAKKRIEEAPKALFN